MRKVTRFAALFICVFLLSTCSAISSLSSGVLPSWEIDYDTQPTSVIVYSDIHYPGIPMPTKLPFSCYRTFLPALRIWGDGFVYLDQNIMNQRSAVLVGQISHEKILEVLLLMNSQGFFSGKKDLVPVNPSGTMFRIGATLKNRPAVEYSDGESIPVDYPALLNVIKPELTSLVQQRKPDPRADAILEENTGCNK
jgi:hypothetical protein